EVASDHAKAGGQPWVADGPESIEILVAVDGSSIREAPAVAMSDGGAHLVHRGEAPLVRGAEVAEEFARELIPVIIQEVLDRAGHRTMVIGGGKEEGVGPRYGCGDGADDLRARRIRPVHRELNLSQVEQFRLGVVFLGGLQDELEGPAAD